MSRESAATYVAILVGVTISGCADLFEDSSLLEFERSIGDRAYFQYFEESSGFVTLPSTIWEMDLNTGESRELHTPRVQYDVQVADDYYVGERPTADEQGSRIVGVQISSDEEFVILERDIELGGRYDRVFVLAGSRVVARTEEGLLIYDLDARAIVKTIGLDDALVEIHAASEEWALVVRDDVFSGGRLLVNLETEEVVAVPAIPGDFYGLFFDAAIADEYLYTSSFRLEGGAGEAVAVQALHIPTLAWETLVDYGTQLSAGPMPFVAGADESYVLVKYTNLLDERLELVNRVSKERMEVSRRRGIGSYVAPVSAWLADGRVHWYDPVASTLVTYEIETGEQSTLAVNIPE